MGGVFAKALGRLVGKQEMRILMVRAPALGAALCAALNGTAVPVPSRWRRPRSFPSWPASPRHSSHSGAARPPAPRRAGQFFRTCAGEPSADPPASRNDRSVSTPPARPPSSTSSSLARSSPPSRPSVSTWRRSSTRTSRSPCGTSAARARKLASLCSYCYPLFTSQVPK